MTLARQWRGTTPYEETWFLEVLLGPDRGLWVRYVLDATHGVAEVWGLLMDRAGLVYAHKAQVPIGSIAGPLFAGGPGRLERDRATGQTGELSWDLRVEDRGARHRHVPFWARMLGVGRTYAPAVLDLRVTGTVRLGGELIEVSAGPGVLGHLWGTGSTLTRWAWAHCNAFDREDLLFEGLSVELGRPLTSLVLLADGHAYRFSRTRDLLRTTSRFDGRSWAWVFEARNGSRVLSGEARLDPERSSRVRYARDDRDDLVCVNTRFADLRVVLHDPTRRVDLDLRSRECAFEIVQPGTGPTDL